MDVKFMFWLMLATLLCGFVYSARKCTQHKKDHVEWFFAAMLLMIFLFSVMCMMG